LRPSGALRIRAGRSGRRPAGRAATETVTVKLGAVVNGRALIGWLSSRRLGGRSRPGSARAVAAAGAVLAVLALAGCGVTGSSAHARWITAAGPSGGPSAAPTPGDDRYGGGDDPAAGGSAPPVPGDFLARIPHFASAPPPQPVTVPAGPSAAYLSHIPTTQPVAFLTIDDGWTQVPQAVQLVRAAHVPVTLFLTINAIRGNPGYFKQLQAAGAVIEAHTLTHTDLKGKSYVFQKREACGSADQLGSLYGRRPVLFRPPFGDEDPTTLRVVHDCGMKAAFFWKETVNAGIVRYQDAHKVQAGDIILMHFRPAFVADFLAALQAIHDAGLTPALLENYVA
jgi:peptidoglycan/xylan/chitin deacetylase (PgdA/CDA1 family)